MTPQAKQTTKTYQRRLKIIQTKHGAQVTSPNRKIYNRAYQLPKNRLPKIDK